MLGSSVGLTVGSPDGSVGACEPPVGDTEGAVGDEEGIVGEAEGPWVGPRLGASVKRVGGTVGLVVGLTVCAVGG